ncbi:MAG: hypothetical protein Q8O83_00010 [bacterium]|nr:hypothetical protein [bacterium]
MNFNSNLKYGQVGESRIAEWLKSRGNSILPVYEIEKQTGKGPRLFSPDRSIIAPDMFIFKGKDCFWIEAKHKTAFTWHRITNRWVTGIDLKHYGDYCIIDDYSPFPVWLLFLHEGGQAKDSPSDSPKGLFGNALEYLRTHENHRHENWGNSGMVYWAIEALKRMQYP